MEILNGHTIFSVHERGARWRECRPQIQDPNDTVDGRNPASPGMCTTWQILGLPRSSCFPHSLNDSVDFGPVKLCFIQDQTICTALLGREDCLHALNGQHFCWDAADAHVDRSYSFSWPRPWKGVSWNCGWKADLWQLLSCFVCWIVVVSPFDCWFIWLLLTHLFVCLGWSPWLAKLVCIIYIYICIYDIYIYIYMWIDVFWSNFRGIALFTS